MATNVCGLMVKNGKATLLQTIAEAMVATGATEEQIKIALVAKFPECLDKAETEIGEVCQKLQSLPETDKNAMHTWAMVWKTYFSDKEKMAESIKAYLEQVRATPEQAALVAAEKAALTALAAVEDAKLALARSPAAQAYKELVSKNLTAPVPSDKLPDSVLAILGERYSLSVDGKVELKKGKTSKPKGDSEKGHTYRGRGVTIDGKGYASMKVYALSNQAALEKADSHRLGILLKSGLNRDQFTKLVKSAFPNATIVFPG